MADHHLVAKFKAIQTLFKSFLAIQHHGQTKSDQISMVRVGFSVCIMIPQRRWAVGSHLSENRDRMGFIAPARPGNRYSLFPGTTDAVVGGAVTFCQWPAVLHSFNQIRVSDVGHTKCHQIQLIIFQSLLCDIR
jgi:hypothetical protein